MPPTGATLKYGAGRVCAMDDWREEDGRAIIGNIKRQRRQDGEAVMRGIEEAYWEGR